MEEVNIKGVSLVKLYIPTVSEELNALNDYTCIALPLILSALFRNNILHMQIKEATSEENFSDAEETILISANQKPVAA